MLIVLILTLLYGFFTFKGVKNILLAIVSVIALLSILFNLKSYFSNRQNSSSPNILVTANVSNVIDGDTFDIGSDERIRLYEVNAPEYPKGCMGVDAKTRLENLISGAPIRYEKMGKDNFGRILAYVFKDKLLINEIMADEGLAYYMKGKIQTSYSLTIEKAQEKARLTGRGVWSPLCQTKKEGCLIKGNYRPADNTRIYHIPGCYNYDKATIKPGTSDRWFCTEEEATAAGFVKSKDCPN